MTPVQYDRLGPRLDYNFCIIMLRKRLMFALRETHFLIKTAELTVCHLYMWMVREMAMAEHGYWLHSEMGKMSLCLSSLSSVKSHILFSQVPFWNFYTGIGVGL